MSKFSELEFRTQPWFDQLTFQGFNQLIPMRTIVIYCFDPRAAEVPQAVARYFGDEVYPGENILDEAGNRVASIVFMDGVSRTSSPDSSSHQRLLFPALNDSKTVSVVMTNAW